jgi:hypothetical protein
MKFSLRSALTILTLLICGSANAQGLVSVSQNSVPNIDPVPPQVETLPLAEESFAFVDRTHEITAARVDPATGLLNTAATGNLIPFPAYLLGARYVANANDNRTAGTDAVLNDYRVTYTVNTPGTAYLLLDNRLDGTAGNVSKTNTTDPDLGGNLAWVLNEGWTRVSTGIMPNGQADYLGLDEGATVASPDLRTHHDPGPGVGLNQFYAIYSRPITAAGTFTTSGIRQPAGSGNMYVVAFQAIPEPSTIALAALGGIALVVAGIRRRQAKP